MAGSPRSRNQQVRRKRLLWLQAGSVVVSGSTFDQSLTATLDDVAVVVSQTATHPQSLSATLDGVAVAVSQEGGHPQALAATLDGLTIAASQAVAHPQALSATLDGVDVEVVQSKVSTYDQAAVVALDDVTATVSQVAQHDESVVVTLEGVTVAVVQGQLGDEPVPEQVSAPGWSAYVREIKRKQRRHKLPLSEEDELIHPEVPESSHAEDATPRELVSAEKFAQLMTRGLRQPLAPTTPKPAPKHDDEEDVELLLMSL